MTYEEFVERLYTVCTAGLGGDDVWLDIDEGEARKLFEELTGAIDELKGEVKMTSKSKCVHQPSLRLSLDGKSPHFHPPALEAWWCFKCGCLRIGKERYWPTNLGASLTNLVAEMQSVAVKKPETR